MKWYLKILHVLSWIVIGFLFTFPLLLFPLFTDMSWWWIFTPGLIPLGFIAVPLALHICSYEPHKDRREVWPDLLWLWGNDQEGPPDWWDNGERKFAAFQWYATRNPVNNFRYLFKDPVSVNVATNWFHGGSSGVVVPMEAAFLREAGQAVAWRWLWAGPYAGYRRVWLNGQDRYSEIWFGWKLGSTVPGLGFTGQVRPKRKIGT